MTYRTVRGNLLEMAAEGKFDMIIQGCNCFNTMGGGLAKQIKERFPEAWEVDRNTIKGSMYKLGNYTSALIKEGDQKFHIINAYTQYHYNRQGENKDVFEYTAFRLITEKLAKEYPSARVGMPLIGCGLAGGDKEKILDIIEDYDIMLAKNGGYVTLVEYQ